jgi:hypothetical protein
MVDKDYVKVNGVPGTMLLPAREYKFKVFHGNVVITIPRKGAYIDLDPDFFTDKDGSFHFLEKDTFFLPSLTKVLFACNKYPDLKDNQAFVIVGLRVVDDVVIEIIGNVIEFLEVGDDDADMSGLQE